MTPLFRALSLFLSYLHFVNGHLHQYQHPLQEKSVHTHTAHPGLAINGIPFSTRAYWMRRANQALSELGSPCPFAAFGTAIVNHTDQSGVGDLVCIGLNNIAATGNPILHGEMAAINNCTAVLSDPDGPYKLSGPEVAKAWSSLSLYTNAEPCLMCSAAIRYGGFKELIYGTSIDTLIDRGWAQIRITSMEVFRQSFDRPHATRLIASVLANETTPYFSWQFDPDYRCPTGCHRVGGYCEKLDEQGTLKATVPDSCRS